MRLLIVIILLFPSFVLAQSEEQILTVVSSPDTVMYVFAHKTVTVDLSKIPDADREFIRETFWAADLTNGKFTRIKICSKDSTEHAAVINQLKTFNITPVERGIELTVQQKADVIASQIVNKARAIKYLKLCAQLRTDNPLWSDATVRTVAKGGL